MQFKDVIGQEASKSKLMFNFDSYLPILKNTKNRFFTFEKV